MERYLDQLIEDLRKRALEVPPPGELWRGVDMADEYDVEDLAYIEQYFYGIPEPLSKILGIEQYQLPPIDKITGEQIARLYPELEKLLNAFRFFPEYPKGLPVLDKYRTLRDAWDIEVVLIGGGENHIEFCEEMGWCPFPVEFCLCKEAEELLKREEEEDRKRRNGNREGDEELPF